MPYRHRVTLAPKNRDISSTQFCLKIVVSISISIIVTSLFLGRERNVMGWYCDCYCHAIHEQVHKFKKQNKTVFSFFVVKAATLKQQNNKILSAFQLVLCGSGFSSIGSVSVWFWIKTMVSVSISKTVTALLLIKSIISL